MQQVNIQPDDQVAYMKKHNDEYYVCLYDGVFAGFIGVVDEDLRIAVVPKFRRKGIGTFMLQHYPPYINRLPIKILPDNIPSQKLFEKNGYKLKYLIYGKW